jgi:hypothetical protein
MARAICAGVMLAAILLRICSCSNPESPQAGKDPRTYSWRIDTIYVPGREYTEMYSVWGFSPTDVYVGGSTPNYPGKLWHFGGTKWDAVPLWTDEGGPLTTRFGDIHDLHGTPDGNFYAVGSTGSGNAFMIRFNGSNWLDVTPSTRFLTRLHVQDPSTVWVGGVNGIALLFNGNSYNFTQMLLPLPIPPDANPFWICRSLTAHGTKPPIMLISAPLQAKNYYLEYVGGSWSVFDSAANEDQERVWYSPDGTLYAAGDRVRRRTANAWEDLPLELRAFGICGTSANNLFMVGTWGGKGRVFHFNGVNWYLYTQIELPNVVFYDCWANGTTIFAVGVVYSGYPRKSIVVQGS